MNFDAMIGKDFEEGLLKLNTSVRVLRRDIEVGRGTIKNLQQMKSDVKQVNEGEFGMQVDEKFEIAPGDILEGFELVIT